MTMTAGANHTKSKHSEKHGIEGKVSNERKDILPIRSLIQRLYFFSPTKYQK